MSTHRRTGPRRALLDVRLGHHLPARGHGPADEHGADDDRQHDDSPARQEHEERGRRNDTDRERGGGHRRGSRAPQIVERDQREPVDERDRRDERADRDQQHEQDRGRRDRGARNPAAASTRQPDGEAEKEQRRKCDQVAFGEVVDVLGREDAHLGHERAGEGGDDCEVSAQARVILAVRDGAGEQGSDRTERQEAGQQSQISGVVDDIAQRRTDA